MYSNVHVEDLAYSEREVRLQAHRCVVVLMASGGRRNLGGRDVLSSVSCFGLFLHSGRSI